MTTRPRTMLITAPLDTIWLARLQKLAPEFHVKQWHYSTMGSIPDDLWQDVEVLYTSFTTPLPLPHQVPHLRWVQLYSAGPDYILDHPLFATSTIFTTTSGIHAVPIAEYVFAMVLAWFHHLPRIFEWQQRGAWPFGMRVLAMQRGINHHDAGFSLPGVGDPSGALPDHFYSPGELPALLGASDVVVIALPLTTRTRSMFDEATFQMMKPTALLVNIARGDICQESALIRALQEKQIAGAILDVFHQDPLPSDHPLWRLPNVFISPHCSSLTSLYAERAAQVCEENLRRYLGGEPMFNIVDKNQEY